MTVFHCEQEWEAMLTCIYEANSSKKGRDNIRLCFSPIEQYSLFDEYIEVKADSEKALKVMDAINTRISAEFYSRIAYTAMAMETDVLDNIYRMLLLGFNFGPSVLDMYQYEVVMRHNAIYKRFANEVHSFREFLRFHKLNEDIYVSYIEPKSHVVIPLGECFADRMPSEHFMIVDMVHREAVVHPKEQACYMRRLSEDELDSLLEYEKETDRFTDLWKIFFDSIMIKERKNKECQDTLFPKWMRKHAVEFQ